MTDTARIELGESPANRRVHWVATALMLGAGCLPEFEQVQREHILYENSDELYPCAGNADYVDGVVPFLERQLAVTASGRCATPGSWTRMCPDCLSTGARAPGIWLDLRSASTPGERIRC